MPKVLTSMTQRIKAAAAAVRDDEAALQLSRATRDDLIRDAVDSGELSTRAAAAAAGFVGPSAVARILAKPDDDD